MAAPVQHFPYLNLSICGLSYLGDFGDNRKPFLSVILTLNVFPSMLPYALYCGIYLLSRNEYLVFHVVGFTNNFFEGSGVVFWFLLVIVF